MKKLVKFTLLIMLNCFANGSDIINIKNITNGINYIDLNNDGVKDLVLKGHYHNISAHDYDTFSFYINYKIYNDTYQIVKTTPEEFIITNQNGADCQLKTIKIVNIDNKNKILVVSREFGASYTDYQTVNFSIFNIGFDDISRTFSLEQEKTYQTTQKYCDVNEAIKNEFSRTLNNSGIIWKKFNKKK